MDVIVERPAALDVHKEQVTACVRLPAQDGTRAEDNLTRAVELTRLVVAANTAAATGSTMSYRISAV